MAIANPHCKSKSCFAVRERLWRLATFLRRHQRQRSSGNTTINNYAFSIIYTCIRLYNNLTRAI